ncbi:MAG: hypothetical protein HZC52_10190, partial [Planctomycetes bacterium]|nr:hypothetical protein [Planctomycetota bacterium]
VFNKVIIDDGYRIVVNKGIIQRITKNNSRYYSQNNMRDYAAGILVHG